MLTQRSTKIYVVRYAFGAVILFAEIWPCKATRAGADGVKFIKSKYVEMII